MVRVIFGIGFLLFVAEVIRESPLIIACGAFDYEHSCEVSIADGYYTVGEAWETIVHPLSYSSI